MHERKALYLTLTVFCLWITSRVLNLPHLEICCWTQNTPSRCANYRSYVVLIDCTRASGGSLYKGYTLFARVHSFITRRVAHVTDRISDLALFNFVTRYAYKCFLNYGLRNFAFYFEIDFYGLRNFAFYFEIDLFFSN